MKAQYYAPYLRKRTYALDPTSVAFIEHFTSKFDAYEDKALARIVIEHAKQVYSDAEYNSIADEVEKFILKPSFFYEERLLMAFDSLFSDDDLSSFRMLSTSTGESAKHIMSFRTNESELDKLLTCTRRCTQAYYLALDGYFPSQIDCVEGFFKENMFSSNAETTNFHNDASDNVLRKLTIIISLKQHHSKLVMVGDDESKGIELTKGKVLLFPCSYTTTYKIIGPNESVSLIKAFRTERT